MTNRKPATQAVTRLINRIKKLEAADPERGELGIYYPDSVDPERAKLAVIEAQTGDHGTLGRVTLNTVLLGCVTGHFRELRNRDTGWVYGWELVRL
jgi:hypothetical protein